MTPWMFRMHINTLSKARRIYGRSVRLSYRCYSDGGSSLAVLRSDNFELCDVHEWERSPRDFIAMHRELQALLVRLVPVRGQENAP